MNPACANEVHEAGVCCRCPLKTVRVRWRPLASVSTRGSVTKVTHGMAWLALRNTNAGGHSRQISSSKSGLNAWRPPPAGWTITACRASRR